jgi:hypothetical protein
VVVGEYHDYVGPRSQRAGMRETAWNNRAARSRLAGGASKGNPERYRSGWAAKYIATIAITTSVPAVPMLGRQCHRVGPESPRHPPTRRSTRLCLRSAITGRGEVALIRIMLLAGHRSFLDRRLRRMCTRFAQLGCYPVVTLLDIPQPPASS